MFISETLPHDEEETWENGVLNTEGIFYRGSQTHTQAVHFPRWHSQGWKQEHNKKPSQVPNGTPLKQASAPKHQLPGKYLLFPWQISPFHISRHPRGQISKGWCRPFPPPVRCPESPGTAARGLSTRQLHPGALLLLTLHTTDIPHLLAMLS